MKNILFFTYYERHLKKLLPLINGLRMDKRLNIYVVLMTQEEKMLAEEMGLQYHMLDEYTDKPRNYNFDLGWGLEPLIKAIEQIVPDLFIAIEVNYILRNAIRYCKQKGIHNLILQHGLVNKYSLQAFLPFEGETFLAWGEYTKDYLIQNYFDEKRILITGGINFDQTLKINPHKNRIANYFSINPDKKWIVFTTQAQGTGGCPSQDEIYYAVTETARAAARHTDFQLIYQVHPSQPTEDIEKMLSNVKGNTAVIGKYHDTEELIAASDALITFFSTTAVDALILGKPIMLINLTDDKDFLPFVKQGAAIGAFKPEEIASSFNKLLEADDGTKSKMNDIINSINYKNDGKALTRVLDKCYDILGSGGINE